MKNLKKQQKCETLNCNGNGNVNEIYLTHKNTKTCPNKNSIVQKNKSIETIRNQSNAIQNLFCNFLQKLKEENINFDFVFSKFKFKFLNNFKE